MMVVGLTGGIGSGKTTVANMFADLKVPVYNSDKEAKSLMNNSKPLRKQIKTLLGKEAYKDKMLNRKFIADKVFVNSELLSELNKIVHPAVRNHFLEWKEKQKSGYVIQETALIFENSSQKNFDKIILVTAPEEIRIQRVVERDNLSVEKIKERIENQWSDEKKAQFSDFMIINLDLKQTKQKVKEIHKVLLKISTLTD
tara:strand:+ start:5619 stop:6215 length:597 start_codon:yes stop_codon:yes gene_type:complete